MGIARCDYGEGLVVEWSEFEYDKISEIRSRPNRGKQAGLGRKATRAEQRHNKQRRKQAIHLLLNAGLSRKEIAQQLFIPYGTVKDTMRSA